MFYHAKVQDDNHEQACNVCASDIAQLMHIDQPR